MTIQNFWQFWRLPTAATHGERMAAVTPGQSAAANWQLVLQQKQQRPTEVPRDGKNIRRRRETIF